ncbi:MAG: sigma factor-like helix-turn-helix DNA-binding protein [Patescibacteria group bacterium]|nr:sigma factor-like helix-turn-helix DNA-binding protein [Patescibacteria group bacterium]
MPLIKYEKLVSDVLDNISNERTRDIIRLRFGLKDGERLTLERIGKNYGITRERVRQIEEAAFSDLKKASLVKTLKPAFDSINVFFNREGKVAREERLLSVLSGAENPHPSRGAIFFVLTLGDSYRRLVESDQFYPLWINSGDATSKARNLIDFLIKKIEKDEETVSLNHLVKLSKGLDAKLEKKALYSYLDATKQINQNSFGRFGLTKWPEINPRGAKDRAYIIFKEEKRPLHFREVADLINRADLGTTVAQAQTVHNELIKDGRFILVGRGTYALKDWGYQPGTIKDVIIQTLKDNGPLAKEEILKKVLENRLVKQNTVLINLQDKRFFVKEGDKYAIAK